MKIFIFEPSISPSSSNPIISHRGAATLLLYDRQFRESGLAADLNALLLKTKFDFKILKSQNPRSRIKSKNQVQKKSKI